MHIPVPVNVTDVPRLAGAHEAHGHHRVPLPVVIHEPAILQGPAVHQPPRAHVRLVGPEAHIPGDAPFREVPGLDAGHGGGRILLVGGREAQVHGGEVEEPAQLRREAGLGNLLAQGEPGVEPAHEHRVIGEVHHGPGAEGGDHLALADLAWRASPAWTAHTSSSTSMPSSVCTQRLTLGSTSRIERFARNF